MKPRAYYRITRDGVVTLIRWTGTPDVRESWAARFVRWLRNRGPQGVYGSGKAGW